METRANFILIGAFTLAAILGTLGFFIWLSSVQLDRQFASYAILFEDVSGLDPSADVLFNGISVGKVTGIQIYEKDTSQVLVTIEVESATPVRDTTVAQVQSQGVTGVAYISLTGGAAGAAPLPAAEGALPIIPSKRSTVQLLVEDAPDLLAQAHDLMAQLQTLTGPDNQARVSGILQNLESSSARLDEALTDFSEISETVSEATSEITRFTDRLDSISGSVETALERVDMTLGAAQSAFETAETTLQESNAAIGKVTGTFDAAEALLRERAPALLEELSGAVAQADTAIADLKQRGGATLDDFAETSELMNMRLTELGQTLQEADQAFTSVSETSDHLDALITGEGAQMVDDAREVIGTAQSALTTLDTLVQSDIAAVARDIRDTMATASEAVEEVAADVTGLTTRFDPTMEEVDAALASANALFERSGLTLDRIDTSLAGADAAMASAETAFDAVHGVIESDLAPVLSEMRVASERIGAAVEQVTRDVPALAEDLRGLISRADAVVASAQSAVDATAPPLLGFARTGLPELSRLSADARGLVANLNGLVRRLERDPARFLLDKRVPDYRR